MHYEDLCWGYFDKAALMSVKYIMIEMEQVFYTMFIIEKWHINHKVTRL